MDPKRTDANGGGTAVDAPTLRKTAPKRTSKAPKQNRGNRAVLVIPTDLISDTTLQGLVDELVVPLIVDTLFRNAAEQ